MSVLKQDMNNQEKNYVQSAMMLDWLGQAPIIINRAFIELTGNVLAALWLSYAIEKIQERETDGNSTQSAVISISGSECEKDTGITRAQQQTCRKTLAAIGLLSEEGGQGKVLRFRIHLDKMMQMLHAQVQPMAEALQRADQQALGLAEQSAGAGLSWWNNLDEQQRKHWMKQAGDTGVAADAWAAFQDAQAKAS